MCSGRIQVLESLRTKLPKNNRKTLIINGGVHIDPVDFLYLEDFNQMLK
jgi:hypothetical protein